LTNPFLPLKNPHKPQESGDAPGPWVTDPTDSSTSEPSSSPIKPPVNGDPGKPGAFPYKPLGDPEDDDNPARTVLEDITPFRESKVDCGAWVRNSPFRTQESKESEGGDHEEVWTDVSLDDPETPTTSSLFKKVSFFNGGYNCRRTRSDSAEEERRSSEEMDRPQVP